MKRSEVDMMIARIEAVWNEAETFRSRSSFSRHFGFKDRWVVAAIRRRGLKRPHHWARNGQTIGKIRQFWGNAGKYDTKKAFAIAAGVSVVKINQFLREEDVNPPDHWRIGVTLPVKRDVLDAWWSASRYDSMGQFARAIGVSEATVFRARLAFNLDTPDHWKTAERRGEVSRLIVDRWDDAVDVEIAWIDAENQIIASLQTNVTPETVRTSEEVSTPSGEESQITESVTSGGDNSTTDYSYSEVGV